MITEKLSLIEAEIRTLEKAIVDRFKDAGSREMLDYKKRHVELIATKNRIRRKGALVK